MSEVASIRTNNRYQDVVPGVVFGALSVISEVWYKDYLGTKKAFCCIKCNTCGVESSRYIYALHENSRCNSCPRGRPSCFIHGKSHFKLYDCWQNMCKRCCDEKNKRYKDYGGRGIKVCQEWLDNYPAFDEWAMANGYMEGLQINRIDNDGDYSPENCEWVTRSVNQRNMRTNRNVTIFNETKPMVAWVEDHRCIVNLSTFRCRVDRGWDVEMALTTPSNQRNRRSNRRFEVFGESKTVAEWAEDERCLVSKKTLYARIMISGWDISTAITTKARPLNPREKKLVNQ